MIKVLVPFTQGVEEIEMVAIVDILRRADINVVMASLDGKPVTGRSNIVITPDTKLEDTLGLDWDMLVLPGGQPNANLLKENPLLQALAQGMAQSHKYIAAICAAPAALAYFGLLNDKQVASHPSVQEEIEQYTSNYVHQAVAKDGNIITSQGAGTAIAFALTLVAVLTSQQIADDIKAAILA
jgi:4-methyl-5(b-hydroxyethyl)-thiazole monophosphate biosynthesis